MATVPRAPRMSPLHISIDAHWLVCHPNSGISTYLRGLLNGWLQTGETLHADLIVPFLPPAGREPLFDHPSFRLVHPAAALNPIANLRSQLYWQQIALPRLVRQHPPDVYLSPFHLTPLWLPGIKVVSTIHDLCFLGEPRLSRGRLLHSAQVLTAGLKAARLICISQATQRALAAWSPRLARKSTVVHNGFEGHPIAPAAARALLHQLDPALVPQEYLLWVGIPCARKNLPLLFQAFQSHRQKYPAHQCVIITPPPFQAEMRRLTETAGLASSVKIYSVDDATRDALYRCALAFIFPSTCEGFGYPALEAIVQGCPTFVLPRTSMQELLGADAFFTIKPDGQDLSEKISTLLQSSPAERETLANRLIQRAREFSSAAMARQTLAVLRQAAES